jgi:hypothetical protein
MTDKPDPICLACGKKDHPDDMTAGYCFTCEPYKKEDRKEFTQADHSGKTLKTLVCRKCGGDRWIVGQGCYYTALKCPKCGWECCAHAG